MLQSDFCEIPNHMYVVLIFTLFKQDERAQNMGRLTEKPVAEGVISL